MGIKNRTRVQQVYTKFTKQNHWVFEIHWIDDNDQEVLISNTLGYAY